MYRMFLYAPLPYNIVQVCSSSSILCGISSTVVAVCDTETTPGKLAFPVSTSRLNTTEGGMIVHKFYG